MTNAGARRNKARGSADERDIARILGGKRYPADVGGPCDVEHADYAIQVKGGKAVVTETMRLGLAQARAAAVGTTKLPALVLVDRRGTRLQRYICFPLEEFAAEHGYGCDEL